MEIIPFHLVTRQRKCLRTPTVDDSSTKQFTIPPPPFKCTNKRWSVLVLENLVCYNIFSNSDPGHGYPNVNF